MSTLPAGPAGNTAATRPSLAELVAIAFSGDGALARSDPDLAQREVQQRLAEQVALAIEQRGALVAEAGTGVGKTFAYLVPLLLSGRRALVSTATKSLQDQLFLRDLPRLCAALGLPLTLALLKGRSSYLCLQRLQQARQSDELPDRWAVRTLARVETWAQATRSGDLAELEGLDERSPVIALVTSTRDNCLGGECPQYKACHVMQARREAMAADLVVVNHHLFFADMALRDSGVAELLPSVDVAVFDEAHQLVEAGVQFLGSHLGTAQLIDFARDLLAAGLQQARGLRDWDALAAALELAARQLRLLCAGPLREVRGLIKLGWDERALSHDWAPGLAALAQAAQTVAQALPELKGIGPDFDKLEQRALAIEELAERFTQPTPTDHVRWIDVSPQQARLVESPLDIRTMLSEQRLAAPKAWIFTSATLGDDERLSWFTASTGLEDAVTLRVGSPFDYAAHARLWVPLPFPKPNDAAHPAAVGALAARCAQALGGRTFVLTTTLRVLPLIAEALREALQRDGTAMELLVQGSQPKRALLQRFASGRDCVLVGSQSFWEGIDVPGDALQCVLIDKLPFPPPNDPLVQARVRQIEARGGNAFNEYFVAEAAVALKQGAGRLIRSETDRGLLVVCDPRLRQMNYGARLRAALPPMTELAGPQQAFDWLGELAAAH
ncbi:MAG TPA: ATP-dependent DNA helicase [Rubrivivax sp.]|nr:ATP-dependent DNA helicase [Rubrivivax sp.]